MITMNHYFWIHESAESSFYAYQFYQNSVCRKQLAETTVFFKKRFFKLKVKIDERDLGNSYL